MSDRACWTLTAAAVLQEDNMGRRLQDCNGADALVGGQFPDKFSTEGGTVSNRVHRRGEFTDEMTDT
jgi:hypothetical protein